MPCWHGGELLGAHRQLFVDADIGEGWNNRFRYGTGYFWSPAGIQANRFLLLAQHFTKLALSFTTYSRYPLYGYLELDLGGVLHLNNNRVAPVQHQIIGGTAGGIYQAIK